MKDVSVIRSPDMERRDRVPPGQRATEKWPVLHHGAIPDTDVSKWTFKMWGLVEEERSLVYEEFMALPRVKVFSDVHCVTGWSRLNNVWEGVSSRVVKELAAARPEASFVTIHSAGGYTTNLRLSDFLQDDVLFAFRHDGELLTPEHGYPVRLVVPRLYLWKSAKWVTGIEFMAEDRPGFWESRGYHNRGDPWREERYGD